MKILGIFLFPVLLLSSLARAEEIPVAEENHTLEKIKHIDFNIDGIKDYVVLQCESNYYYFEKCQIILYLVDKQGKLGPKKILKSGLYKVQVHDFEVANFDADKRPDILYSINWIQDPYGFHYHIREYFFIENHPTLPRMTISLFKLPQKDIKENSKLFHMDFNRDKVMDFVYMDKSGQLVKIISKNDGTLYPAKGFYIVYGKNYEGLNYKIKFKGYKKSYPLLAIGVSSEYESKKTTYSMTNVQCIIGDAFNWNSDNLFIPNINKLDFNIRKKLARNEYLKPNELQQVLQAVDDPPEGWVVEEVFKKDESTK